MRPTNIHNTIGRLIILAGAGLLPSAAFAQTYAVDWFGTDGGGATSDSGGAYTLGGTIGQSVAGSVSAGQFECQGGFWSASAPGACYANCDNSTTPPVLNANDFQCFLNSYAAGAAYANCDGSSVSPILNANDFQCFLNAFAGGCS